MGTSGIINIYDGEDGEDPVLLCSIYRQSDGDLDGVGVELVEFASGMKINRGISGCEELRKEANGMGCFAAQLIAHLKHRVGGLYIDIPCEEEGDYTYYFYPPENIGDEPILVCRAMYTKSELFRGPVSEFDLEIAKKNID